MDFFSSFFLFLVSVLSVRTESSTIIYTISPFLRKTLSLSVSGFQESIVNLYFPTKSLKRTCIDFLVKCYFIHKVSLSTRMVSFNSLGYDEDIKQTTEVNKMSMFQTELDLLEALERVEDSKLSEDTKTFISDQIMDQYQQVVELEQSFVDAHNDMELTDITIEYPADCPLTDAQAEAFIENILKQLNQQGVIEFHMEYDNSSNIPPTQIQRLNNLLDLDDFETK